MQWEVANDDEERAMLKRIVALLLSLAGMAELAVTRTPAVRCFVLWLLLRAEAAARGLVTVAPAPCPSTTPASAAPTRCASLGDSGIWRAQ